MIGAARTAGALAVGLFLLVAFTPAPNLVSRWMTPPGAMRPAQAIVVIGGGGLRGDGSLTTVSLRRTQDALRLYRAGAAPLLVFSGPASKRGVEAHVRAATARECGIPDSAILTEATGRTTRGEAVHIARLLQPRDIRTIVLVADAEGLGRAQRVFEKVGFDVVPAATADVSSLAGGPEDRIHLARRVAIELLARVYYAAAGYI